MVTLNTGTVLLNGADLKPDDTAVFCVLGMPRGGTTMAARLLQAAGVHMGENLPVTAEDPQFARLLREVQPDSRQFQELVDQRNAVHRKWGFKAPFRNHWDLLSSIENVRFLVVFRDVLAVANRNRISADADIMVSILANLNLEKAIVNFINASSFPSLLFSYEKAIVNPMDIANAIIDFVGSERNHEASELARAIVQPNEAAYVSAQDPRAFVTRLSVDVLKSDRIAGWARRSNGAAATIAVEVDGRLMATTKATLPRKDLVEKFGGEGRYGFDVRLAPENALLTGSNLVIKNAIDGTVLFSKSCSSDVRVALPKRFRQHSGRIHALDNIVRSLVPPIEKLKKIGPIFDAQTYLRTGARALHNLKRFAYLKAEHSVLDIGCGYGRVAAHLGPFLNESSTYIGFDIVEDEIQWCKENITPQFPNFTFHHLDVANKRYNPAGSGSADAVHLPVDDNSIDLAFLVSVFTHMFPADVKNYLREIVRCLKPGGILFATFFMINEEREQDIARGTSQFAFRRQAGGYWARDHGVHEAAIAYSEEDVYAKLREAGFSRDKVIFGNWSDRRTAEFGQDVTVSSKKILQADVRNIASHAPKSQD